MWYFYKNIYIVIMLFYIIYLDILLVKILLNYFNWVCKIYIFEVKYMFFFLFVVVFLIYIYV